MTEAVSRIPVREFGKFLVTGGLNTLIDFGVLNLLILIFGLAQGDPRYILFKTLSFIAASANSFIFNKWWVFKNKKETDKKEVGSFAVVNGIGLVLNTFVSIAVFSLGTRLFPDLNPLLWANIGGLIWTIFILLFNFFAYKFIVFKK